MLLPTSRSAGGEADLVGSNFGEEMVVELVDVGNVTDPSVKLQKH